MQELFTDADNFGVTFPMDLDVRIKAVIIAAVFLIVSMEKSYEKCPNSLGYDAVYITVPVLELGGINS